MNAAANAQIPADAEDAVYRHLEARTGRLHLQQRLGIEADREAWIFGQGIKFFHLENWYSIHRLIRLGLRLTLLHERARRNALDLQLRHHDVHLAGLPRAFNGFTILQLSDLHLDMNDEFAAVLSDRLSNLDYDLCVMTGDFRYLTFGSYDKTLAALARVRPKLRDPVYGILGNHDTIRMVPAMEEMGVRMLLNESVDIERDGEIIHLVGVDDPHYYRTDNLDRACHGIDHDRISILLAHSPEIYRHAAHCGFDLLLCGHTHGGQICLPGGTPIIYDADCPRRYASGSWVYKGLAGYTSVGTGSSIVDVRLNCPPEITLHRLLCA
jgi:hypothetical protein